MFPVNTQRGLSYEQLAALYSGDARSADAQLFTDSSQSHSFVQDQARRMGISDPASFFANQQTQQQLQTAPSLGAQLANRQAGIFTPGTLPAQLQARDNTWDAVATKEAAQQAQLATLQRTRALSDTPLPQGDTPAFAANSFGAATGLTPERYAMTRRLAGVSEGQQFVGGGNALDPDTLTRDPRFKGLLTTAPDKAAHVFSALTGRDLKTHLTTVAAREKDQDQFGQNTVQDWARSGRMTFDAPSNKWKMRQLVPDPMNLDKLIVGPGYTDPDPFQSELIHKWGPQVAPLLAEHQTLTARIAAHQQQQAAVPQVTRSSEIQPEVDPLQQYQQSQLGYHLGNAMNEIPQAGDWLHGALHTASGFARDTGIMANNAGLGVANLMGGDYQGRPSIAANPNDATVPQAQHVREQLLSNPRFVALLRSNPESAMRIVRGMQQGGL